MRHTIKLAVTALLPIALSMGASTALADGSIEAGKAKSATCVGCHGPNGISFNDMWPNLAGQKKGYLAKQITAFRDGDRNDPMMKPMVQALSDEDIQNLAAYFSSLK